jgi:hypothetical protein
MANKIFDLSLIRYVKLFCNANVFNAKEKKDIVQLIKNLEETQVKQILIEKLPQFEKKQPQDNQQTEVDSRP